MQESQDRARDARLVEMAHRMRSPRQRGRQGRAEVAHTKSSRLDVAMSRIVALLRPRRRERVVETHRRVEAAAMEPIPGPW
jgi:hypothetical protein